MSTIFHGYWACSAEYCIAAYSITKQALPSRHYQPVRQFYNKPAICYVTDSGKKQQRLLTVCVINCCWMRCLWVSSPQDASGWDLIGRREFIWDHFASSGLSTEYRRFSITSVYSSTPMTWSSFFQDCLKIQLDLNKLSEWCDKNLLLLNVGKCKTITIARSRYPVKFSNMLGGTVKQI
jgi:hypothetical protein